MNELQQFVSRSIAKVLTSDGWIRKNPIANITISNLKDGECEEDYQDVIKLYVECHLDYLVREGFIKEAKDRYELVTVDELNAQVDRL